MENNESLIQQGRIVIIMPSNNIWYVICLLGFLFAPLFIIWLYIKLFCKEYLDSFFYVKHQTLRKNQEYKKCPLRFNIKTGLHVACTTCCSQRSCLWLFYYILRLQFRPWKLDNYWMLVSSNLGTGSRRFKSWISNILISLWKVKYLRDPPFLVPVIWPQTLSLYIVCSKH